MTESRLAQTEEGRLARSYLTLAKASEIRYEVKKSIFIGVAVPAKDGVEAVAVLNRERGLYPDAAHHVSAWCVGTGTDTILERYSDDGEPSGTAGMPILNVLKGRSLENTCIVVTRYFGGTLLGTGGLVHAYGESAQLAVEAAKVVRQVLCREYEFEIEYSLYTPISRLCAERNWPILDATFMENVTLKVACPSEEIDTFLLQLRELSHGDVEPQVLGLTYIPLDQ